MVYNVLMQCFYNETSAVSLFFGQKLINLLSTPVRSKKALAAINYVPRNMAFISSHKLNLGGLVDVNYFEIR